MAALAHPIVLVEQLFRFWQFGRGWIKGRKGRRIVIAGGDKISQEYTQVLRNAWNYPVS